jgi:hypothetical protein
LFMPKTIPTYHSWALSSLSVMNDIRMSMISKALILDSEDSAV